MKPFPKDSPGGIPRIIPGRKSMNDELAFYVSNNIVIYGIWYIYIYVIYIYTLYTILNSYIVKLEKKQTHAFETSGALQTRTTNG